ncbi:hypothetical protein ACOB87_43860 [Streptomyces sp. YS-B37]|uniref:hypothetical protein n=1 Tax=unclassified Streptomyces TaxID=2593676 RepID=UPI003B50A15B
MRARDKATVSALRTTLAALDNAEAVPVEETAPRSLSLEQSPVGAGTTEAARRELSEDDVVEAVKAEAAERLDAAAQLTAPAHAKAGSIPGRLQQSSSRPRGGDHPDDLLSVKPGPTGLCGRACGRRVGASAPPGSAS